MNRLNNLYETIVNDLVVAGQNSAYTADATEPDPRYLSYGVRVKEKNKIIAAHRATIRSLSREQQIDLAQRLIKSEYGEQQSIGLFILEPLASYFSPDKFDMLDALIRYLHGWSKVDAFASSLLRDVLFAHREPFLELVQDWNQDSNQWLRRTSVVLFTRKVAKSGLYTDVALKMCDSLLYDEEELVLKGVGWCFKDLMRSDKPRLMAYVSQLRRQGVSSVVTLYAIKDLKGQERAEFLGRSPKSSAS